VTTGGFRLVIGYIEHVQIVTTSNCGAIAISRIPQFTSAWTETSQSAVSSPVVPGIGYQRCSCLSLSCTPVSVLADCRLSHKKPCHCYATTCKNGNCTAYHAIRATVYDELQSQSHSYFTTGVYHQFGLVPSPLELTTRNYFINLILTIIVLM
jgi:hypothetical protein